MRARMSLRTGSPKIASGRSISPTVLLSKLVTDDFIVLFLLRVCRLLGFGLSLLGALAQRGRERQALRRGPLLGVLHQHRAARRTGNRALDQDQAAFDIDGDDLQVLGRHPLITQVARHLLALEGAARILALTGRTVRAVRDRDAVGGAQAAEIPALHDTGEALADSVRRHVDELASLEVVGGKLGT